MESEPLIIKRQKEVRDLASDLLMGPEGAKVFMSLPRGEQSTYGYTKVVLEKLMERLGVGEDGSATVEDLKIVIETAERNIRRLPNSPFSKAMRRIKKAIGVDHEEVP